jgi:hypothetical protein
MLLPSIETDDNPWGSISIHEPTASRPLMPAFSISPPPSATGTILTPSSSMIHGTRAFSESTIDGLGGRIRDLELFTESTTRQASPEVDRRTRDQPRTIDQSRTSSRLALSIESNNSSHGSGFSSPSNRENSNVSISAGIENMATGPDIAQPIPLPAASSSDLELPSPNTANRSTSGRRSSAFRRRSGSHVSHPTHNVADENFSEELFHETRLQEALTNATALVTSLFHVLGSSSLHNEPDSAIRGLSLDASAMSNFQCPSKRTVAFVGDSGVGMGPFLY